jgi:serine protease
MHAVFKKHLLHTLALGLSLTAIPDAEAAAKDLVPRAAAMKPGGAELPRGMYVERLVVKFHEGTRVRPRDGRLVALSAERGPEERSLLAQRGLDDARLARDLASASDLLARVPRAGALTRLFKQDETSLAELKRSGEERGGRQLADLGLYVEVPLLPGTTVGGVQDMLDRLNTLDSVEVAYAEPPAEPAMVGFGSLLSSALLAAADLPPTTASYESRQGYLNAAPGGVDARYSWTQPGGKGAGVRIVDVEGGWSTAHEDMPGLFRMGGTQYNDLGWRNHGTAVLGEMVGAANSYGVTGIAHEASIGYEGIGSQSSASAIANAAAAVGRGGVVLIELHAQGPADSTACTCNQSQCNYIAMEYWQANYDAIAIATANGTHVVEAAGNGSANLDDAAYGGRFNRAVRDSGAILVGASTATTRVPMCWTNFGSRVDVHGWGESVASLGYGDLFGSAYGENQYYTATFSGTSSASPIVTASVADLQGVALARGKGALEPRYLRSLLASTGTPQASDSRNIGRLPNLRQAISQLSVLSWSSSGPIAGKQCTRVYEDSDPYTWNDNYLCY